MDTYADSGTPIDMGAYQQAIKDIESSGGNYGLVGPTTDSGDRAYGAYQVMGNNIPDWTEKHYGTRLTPQEFLKNKDAQDAVFNGEFGSYVGQYGNPQDAASKWFSGRPLAGNNSSDGYTTVPQYVSQFNKGLAKYGSGAPLAFADPEKDDDKEDDGALTTNSTIGPGALSTQRVMNGDTSDNKLSTIAQGLTGLGAALSSITSPQQSYALNQQLQSMKKDNESKYKVSVTKDGKIIRVDQDGNVDVVGGPNAVQGVAPPQIGDFTKTGTDYLATVPPTQRAIVQGIAEGLIPPGSQYKLGDPNTQALLAAAHQYDPTFDGSLWSGRVAGQKDWASGGKSADIAKSLNQSIGHLGDLPQKFDALNNGQSPLMNEAGNWWNQKVLGKTGVTGFKLNAHAVADEMGKLFKGAGLSDREIKQWEEGLGENMSPDQQKESMNTLAGLVRHSMSALEEKRRQAIGPMAAARKGALLNDDAAASLKSIEDWQPKNAKPQPVTVQPGSAYVWTPQGLQPK